MRSGELLMRCKRCGRIVPAREMHYTSDFQLICNDCYNRLYPSKTKPERLAVGKTLKPEPKDWWFCRYCNYKFSVKKGKKPLKCPMCGRSMLEKADRVADRLLKEATTYDENFDEDL